MRLILLAVAFPTASGSFLAYSSLELEDSLAQTPDTWGTSGPTDCKGACNGRQRCEAMACSPIYQNLLSGSPTCCSSFAGTPQANSLPRDSAADLSDSSSDHDDLGSENDPGVDEDVHMFEFSPSAPYMDPEALNNMDHIYI